MTRPLEQVVAARQLRALGFNNCQISRELRIPRGTIRDWFIPRHQERQQAADLRRNARRCQRCNGTESSLAADYVYLLGLYLGDGCLSAQRKGVWRLRIVQDMRYPYLIGECKLAMSAVTLSRVSVQPKIGCVEIGASWKHWVHLFPQHGAGPKWLRPIVMLPWQQELIDAFPGPLLRGLIHSDGCRALNTIKYTRATEVIRSYAYPRYMFSNNSDDIRRLFTDTCDHLGVRWTQTNKFIVAVSRRPDVAFLDTFIGPKS